MLCMRSLMHLRLQPKAEKRLQQLRLERMGPLDHSHAAQSPTTDAVGSLNSTSASTASALSNSDSLAQEDSLAASGTTERLPTKAELRGTLGTVNRKVHMATVVLHLYQRQHSHVVKGCASLPYGGLHLFLACLTYSQESHDHSCTSGVWPKSSNTLMHALLVRRFQHRRLHMYQATCLYKCTNVCL